MHNQWYLSSICPATWEYIEKGLLTITKIRLLSEIKVFIDSVAQKDYLSEQEILDLENKYGSKPSVITWGDYFQSEIAEDNHQKNDEDFAKVVETVRFDIIAAKIIFDNKPRDFFDFVEKNYQEAAQKVPQAEITVEDEEAIHLGILKSYYVNLNLGACHIREEDWKWFEQFAIAEAM